MYHLTKERMLVDTPSGTISITFLVGLTFSCRVQETGIIAIASNEMKIVSFTDFIYMVL